MITLHSTQKWQKKRAAMSQWGRSNLSSMYMVLWITHNSSSLFYFTLCTTQDAIYLPLQPEWMYYHAHKYQHTLLHEAYVQAYVGARAPLKHR